MAINNPLEKKTNPKIHLDFFFEYSISDFLVFVDLVREDLSPRTRVQERKAPFICIERIQP